MLAPKIMKIYALKYHKKCPKKVYALKYVIKYIFLFEMNGSKNVFTF